MLKSLSDVNPEEFLDTREKQHLEMAVLASIMEKAIIRHHQFIKHKRVFSFLIFAFTFFLCWFEALVF